MAKYYLINYVWYPRSQIRITGAVLALAQLKKKRMKSVHELNCPYAPISLISTGFSGEKFYMDYTRLLFIKHPFVLCFCLNGKGVFCFLLAVSLNLSFTVSSYEMSWQCKAQNSILQIWRKYIYFSLYTFALLKASKHAHTGSIQVTFGHVEKEPVVLVFSDDRRSWNSYIQM